MFTTTTDLMVIFNRIWKGFFLFQILFLVAGCSREDVEEPTPTVPFGFKAPSHFPPPVYDFSNNPVTREGFELGRALFYDTRLSRDNSVSCGSCHQQSAGFTHHGHSISHGIDNRLGHRNSPPVQNLAWSRFFMWDGGIFHLDLLPIAAITNPVEMDEDVKRIPDKLKEIPGYRNRFKKVFGTEEINSERMFKALSQFMLMCISAGSKYDQWRLGKSTLSEVEAAGLDLVRTRCSPCHSGELFTDGDFHNNGLGQGRLKTDLGRYHITLQEADIRKFKTPSLRNLRFTGPYMHDGRFGDLRSVLQFYAGNVKDSPTLAPELRQSDGSIGIPLSRDEQDKILAFLETLNDVSFLQDPSLSEYEAAP